MNASIQFYEENASAYFEATRDADNSALRSRFLGLLPRRARLLDAGCGSGRDARAFAEAGHDVTAFDASAALVDLARSHSGVAVRRMLFADMDWRDAFDGVWACASLVHLDHAEIGATLGRFRRAIKSGGLVYVSLKLASSGEGDGRSFTLVTEAEARELFVAAGFDAVATFETADVRPTRSDRWVNVLARGYARLAPAAAGKSKAANKRGK